MDFEVRSQKSKKMTERPLLYFKTPAEFRDWLAEHHDQSTGVYLVFYKLASGKPTMRWEEAVQEALCYGWIDSTVKKLDHEKRRQLFTPRKKKSVWSRLNKTYIKSLIASERMQPPGLDKINAAKKDGSWTALDDVENGIIPDDLQKAFDDNQMAFTNYHNFSPSYRKNYLYWIHMAKREATRQKRIKEIIDLCERNIKSRDNGR